MELPVPSGLKIINLGVHTLKNINLTIEPGQCVGLTGPSGSGKSLLLRAMADLDPHEGSIWLEGVAADQIPAPQWRRQVGLLPAESSWWHDTVGPHFSQVPEGWLRQLGFDAGVMDWKISHLSSGERQRLALLRLLEAQPKVLLLDEPAANLDHRNSQRLETLLASCRQSRPLMIIWVSHDLEQLNRNCDPIYVIEGNRLKHLHGQDNAASGGGP
jgi:ABC-type bacteriocin/lantibiotic exporter with double-glycine peptidase domain